MKNKYFIILLILVFFLGVGVTSLYFKVDFDKGIKNSMVRGQDSSAIIPYFSEMQDRFPELEWSEPEKKTYTNYASRARVNEYGQTPIVDKTAGHETSVALHQLESNPDTLQNLMAFWMQKFEQDGWKNNVFKEGLDGSVVGYSKDKEQFLITSGGWCDETGQCDFTIKIYYGQIVYASKN